jgi:MoaA/NifB/PqqE/SkfB family radical SAM enzyme
MILAGRTPSLSIEITRECPLSCPGCYAYGANHLGPAVMLRQLNDYKGATLIAGILDLVDTYRPLHVSLVGGEPLVRYRELSEVLPALEARDINVQLVTSAVRPIPSEWRRIRNLNIVVSVDGLQPEHDARRKPATYERILKHIREQQVTIHCTVTRHMTDRSGYLREFVQFWSGREEVRKIWISLFTPQRGESNQEILPAAERESVIQTILELRREFPRLEMPAALLDVYRKPPENPDKCIFARTTRTVSADLRRVITPCQFGGNPDCSQCGCVASAALGAVGRHRLPLGIRVESIFRASYGIGQFWNRLKQTVVDKDPVRDKGRSRVERAGAELTADS